MLLGINFYRDAFKYKLLMHVNPAIHMESHLQTFVVIHSFLFQSHQFPATLTEIIFTKILREV